MEASQRGDTNPPADPKAGLVLPVCTPGTLALTQLSEVSDFTRISPLFEEFGGSEAGA